MAKALEGLRSNEPARRSISSDTLARRILASDRAIHRWTLGALSFTIIVVVWALLSRYVINPLILPAPTTVLNEALAMLASGELQRHVFASMRRIILGYVNGSFWGIVLGVVVGRFALIRSLALPPINLIRNISPVALVPLAIVWFGIGELAKILLVGYTSFIVVFFNTIGGVASTPIVRERTARCLGANEVRVFLHVVLPSAVPAILIGLRIGIGLSFMSVVAAELIAANSGIGFLIMQSRFSVLTHRMFVGLIALGVLGFLGDALLRKAIQKWGRAYVGREMSRAF